MTATNVEGWAYDPHGPEEPLVMRALIDGREIGPVTCDLARPDIAAAIYTTRKVGFAIAIPPELQDGRNHALEFCDLDGSPIILRDHLGPHPTWIVPKAQAAPRAVEQWDVILGNLDPVLEGEIRGWAYAKGTANIPVILDIFIDQVFLASIACDAERADVVAAGHPNSKVGFSTQLPGRYFDGQPHMLEIRAAQNDPRRFETAQGPGNARQKFNLPPETVVSKVDGLRNGAVSGWAYRHDRPTGSKRGGLHVLVTMQGHPIAQIIARDPRSDVAVAHGCELNCGFSFVPPARLVAGRTVEFEFRVIPGGHALAGSPVCVNFASLETVAAIRDLQETTDKIFAELWQLRDRLRKLAPGETCKVENYDLWARQYQKSLAAAPDRLAGLLPRDGSPPPLVSIVCPIHRPRLPDFVAAVASVRAQTYRRWELILVDDASKSAELTACIAGLARQDGRIKAIARAKNGGVSAATNTGLARAKGRYVAFLDHDDLLAERAIEFMLAAALRTGAQMLYSDEDKIDDQGMFSEVNLKPDWNYRLLLAQNYVCHLLLVERAQLDKAGPFRSVCDGAQDHDMVIRLSEVIPHARIVHVPEVLYHWRKTPTSTAASGKSKAYAVAAGARAVQDHLDRKGLEGRAVSPREITCFEIEWQVPREPSVSVIIPYREHIDSTRSCLEALRANTAYTNYDVVLLDNWSTSDAAFAFAAEMKERAGVSVLRIEEPFNFSRLNNLGAASSRGELLLFVNNDVVVSEPGWLRAMVGELLADPRVAIVGNKLLYPSGLVQHGGVILGVGGVADHAHRGLARDDPGYVARAISAQDVSAVTAACMLCRRSVFDAVGGFDEQDLQIAFNDVDLCLKAGKAGYRAIWTPSSVAQHWESLSRHDDLRSDQQARFFHENETMTARWQAVIAQDRFYHRAFSRMSGMFADLAAPTVAHDPAEPGDVGHAPRPLADAAGAAARTAQLNGHHHDAASVRLAAVPAIINTSCQRTDAVRPRGQARKTRDEVVNGPAQKIAAKPGKGPEGYRARREP
ncbi:MAG TPA: glycosyltransferase family 2 protein [Acetobacteraceae bacterium]|nr:glycosyltransferase family 2 protein [Acetobacteraceae bacterium]